MFCHVAVWSVFENPIYWILSVERECCWRNPESVGFRFEVGQKPSPARIRLATEDQGVNLMLPAHPHRSLGSLRVIGTGDLVPVDRPVERDVHLGKDPPHGYLYELARA